jgi:hypothetical protein
MTPVDLPPAPRPYTPQLTNSLDRPRLPSLQTKVYTNNRRTPSINFSRPYSSRSSAYSDASSAHEVDYFSSSGPRRLSSPADDHLTLPHRSPGSESTASSLGIPDEDLKKLPRGRRKSRPLDTGVFFHSKSVRSVSSAQRWPQTPVTPTSESAGRGNRGFGSPAEDPMPRINHLSTSTTFSAYSTGTSFVDIPPPPPVPRPATSGELSASPRLDGRPTLRQARSVSQESRRPSTSPRPKSRGSPQAPFTQQSHPREFSSPTQVLNPSRSTSVSLPRFPTEEVDPNDHVTLGIKYHQQDLLPQATHHFQLAAENGEPTGIILFVVTATWLGMCCQS